MSEEIKNKPTARGPSIESGDFIIVCNGLQYDVRKDHLLALSPIFKHQLQEDPRMSLLQLPSQYSSIMKNFQQYVFTSVSTVDQSDSKLFDQLLESLGMECTSQHKMRWTGPDKTLQAILQRSADMNIEDEIMRILLE